MIPVAEVAQWLQQVAMYAIDRLPVRDFLEQHLQELVTGGASEASGRYDFKRELACSSDDEKKELCLDVASFANAGGGLLLFGIDETDAVATSIPGVDLPSVDDVVLKIDNILATNIQPRIPGYQLGVIPLAAGRVVVALRIPRSMNGPHAVVKTGMFRFYTRTTAGKFPMDMPQVRQAFALSEGLRERLRTLRAERVGRILANEGAVPLDAGAKLILQVVPLDVLGSPRRYVVAPYQTAPNQELTALGCQFPYSRRFNLDGVVEVQGFDEKSRLSSGYVQLFEHGWIEAADAVLLRSSDNGERYMNSLFAPSIVREVVAGLERYLRILRDLGVETPIYVFLSMTGLRGRRLFFDNFRHAPVAGDRDDFHFAEVVVQDLVAPAQQIVRPLMDSFFRSFGMQECPWYNAQGMLTIPH